jgi:hypothetical protein
MVERVYLAPNMKAPDTGESIDELEGEIERLKQKISLLKSESKNVIKVVPSPSPHSHDALINGNWAFVYYDLEQQGRLHLGRKKSGHLASLYLADSNGTWFNEHGKQKKDTLVRPMHTL